MATICASSAHAQIATATTLTVTSNGSAVTTVASGTAVTLTATVLAGGTPVTPGLVNFCDATAAHCTDVHILGSEQLTNTGTASLHLVPGPGNHSFKAVFAGTRGITTSTSTEATLAVTHSGQYATATTLAANGAPGTYTVTATVGGNGGILPTGTMSFTGASNGNVALGTTAVGLSFGLSSFEGGMPYQFVNSSVVADFNGDGILDMAVVEGSDNVAILFGNGDGTFTQQTTFPTGSFEINMLIVADFNGDGIPDLAVSTAEGAVIVKLGDGKGNFSPGGGPTMGRTLAAGDFNGDGIADLIAVGGAGGGCSADSQAVYVALGQGSGTFSTPTGIVCNNQQQSSIVTADFNGDGNLDVAIDNNSANIVVLLGNGDGTFTPAVGPAAGKGFGLAVIDVNGDGIPDLITPQNVFLGNGDGTFTPGGATTGTDVNTLLVGDFNADGVADLAALDLINNVVSVYLGDGASGFAAHGAFPNSTEAISMVSGDFNGDGIPDLGVIAGLNTVTIASTHIESTAATQQVTLPPATGTHQLNASYAGDANYTGSSSTINLSSAMATPTMSLVPSSNPAVKGTPLTMMVTVSGIGLVPTGTIALSSDGQAISTSSLSNGMVSIPVTLTLGQHTVVASYAGDTNYTTGSATITETIQASAGITLTPPGLPAGTVGNVYSQTFSASGGTAPYTYVVTNGSLPAGLTLGTSGLLSGTPTISGTSTFTITATDANSATGAQSYTLAVNPQSTSISLTLTSNGNPVTSVTAGTPVTLTATVLVGATPVGPGLVTFCDATADHCTDVHIVGTAQLTSTGTATLPFVPGPGAHTYKAIFAGKRGVTATTSTSLTLTVTHSGIYASATSPTSTGSAGNYTLTASVGGNGGVLPTGTVSFMDSSSNNALLGTETLGTTVGGLVLGNIPFATSTLQALSNAVCDFNGDGIPDMAVVILGAGEGGTGGNVSIYFGNGDGTFQLHGSFTPDSFFSANGVTCGDFNSDGHVDLALSDLYLATLEVVLGDGQGNFGESSVVSDAGNSFVVGDFNGDGVPDLIGASYAGFQVLLGNGDGTFTAAPNLIPRGTEVIPTVVVADFNRDGILDFAVLDTLYLGNGDGTFTTGSPLSSLADGNGLAVGDFNGDGIPDLVTGGALFLGNGDGTFTAAAQSPGIKGPVDVLVTGDFNQDGFADLAADRYGTISVSLGDGKGDFSPQPIGLPTSNYVIDIAVGDLNGDGTADLAVMNAGGNLAIAAPAFVTSTSVAQQVTLPIATGSHQVVINYSGDANYAPSTGTIGLTSAMGTPTVTLTPSSNPSLLGSTLNLAVVVSGSGFTPTGLLNFYDDGRLLEGIKLSSGAATYSSSALTLGLHTITISYAGDSNYSAGSATLAETIQASPGVNLSPTTLTAGTVGSAYSQTISASGGTAPYNFAVTSGALPAGLTLSSAGVLAGTPTATGSSSFTITATDSSANKVAGSLAYTLTVNPIPTITLLPTSLAAGTVGTAYSQMFSANGGTAPYTYTATNGTLPAGLTLSASGLLSGIPTTSGTSNFTVTATDNSANKYTGSLSYSLTINAAPVVTITLAPASLGAGTVGTAYSQSFAASGGTAPYTYMATNGALPPGMTLSTAGILSGTPTASGTSTFTITATDSSSNKNTGSLSYALTINAAPVVTISLAPTSLANGIAGSAYAQTISASGGTAPYTYTVTTGALPAGLALSSAGIMSGTPTSSGTSMFTITAADSSANKNTGSLAYTLTINPAPTVTITLTPTSLAAGTVGSAYSQTISATGGTAPYSFAVTTGALPAGLTLSGGGVISGTPSASGTSTFTITATDSSTSQYTGSQSYSLTIYASTVPPVNVTTTSPATQTVTAGDAATFAFNLSPSSGSFADPVTFSATGLPPGATASFSPASLPAHSTGGQVSLTIQTASTSAQLGWPGAGTALGLLLLPLAGFRRLSRWNKRLKTCVMLAVIGMAAAVLGLNGCGGGSTVTNPNPNPTAYKVVVHITTGNNTQTTTVNLDVN